METMMTIRYVVKRGAAAIAMAASGVFLTYCSAINIFPISEDQKLGAQFDQQIRNSSSEYPLLNNSSARRYVQSIVDKIKRAPDVEYDDTFAYKVEIINDDETINAFCTPGGYIYVYTGLIKMLDNEAGLAGVIGHEIAHAERRHSTSRMTKQLGVQTVMDMVMGTNNSQTIDLAANAITGLGLLANSRADEDEADEYSFKYLQSTVWYPGGIRYFFDKVKGRGGSSLEELFSTHPLPQSRLDNLNDRLRKENIPPPTEAQLRSREYAQFKNSLGSGGKTGNAPSDKGPATIQIKK